MVARPKPFGALIFDNRTTTALRGNAASAQEYKARLLLLGRECGRCARPMPRQLKKQSSFANGYGGQGKGNKTMTKTEIIEARAKLVRTILAIKKLKTQKTALAKTLEPDFEAHEAEYRNGVKTDAGVLVRKPKWNFDAKPVVEVAG